MHLPKRCGCQGESEYASALSCSRVADGVVGWMFVWAFALSLHCWPIADWRQLCERGPFTRRQAAHVGDAGVHLVRPNCLCRERLWPRGRCPGPPDPKFDVVSADSLEAASVVRPFRRSCNHSMPRAAEIALTRGWNGKARNGLLTDVLMLCALHFPLCAQCIKFTGISS